MLGVTYFNTPKKRETFVKRENLTLYCQKEDAASRIQSALGAKLRMREGLQPLADD